MIKFKLTSDFNYVFGNFCMLDLLLVTAFYGENAHLFQRNYQQDHYMFFQRKCFLKESFHVYFA
jgi:hypothetical protein